MKHPQLGVLELKDDSTETMISFDGRKIPIRIELDGVAPDAVLSFAVIIANSLEAYDQISREIITTDLLDAYNSGWNEYDEVQADGTTESIVNPILSSAEFKAHFLLTSVTITGDSSVDLWYEDVKLFWGHSVFVGSLDGTDFTNARAQLFG